MPAYRTPCPAFETYRAAVLLPVLLLGACAGLRPVATAAPEPGAVAALDRLSPGDCNEEVAAALAGSGIPVSRVESLTYGLYRDDRTGNISAYDAWLKMRDQPGSVVLKLDRFCRPVQFYNRGGA